MRQNGQLPGCQLARFANVLLFFCSLGGSTATDSNLGIQRYSNAVLTITMAAGRSPSFIKMCTPDCAYTKLRAVLSPERGNDLVYLLWFTSHGFFSLAGIYHNPPKNKSLDPSLHCC
ncbi:hypothetical protein B0H15DRAFT_337515 [Mycena belliarum]|uniref:Secreted protein n=1 Tax=Mycena belliarum TaxID=1033014 RepID=A0AAD6XVN2_9AGAR|nr:hypothetical protein B0H15DRAFT_337515 [Mycena belliae]